LRKVRPAHISTTSTTRTRQLGLIMKIGLLPDGVKPGIHCAGTPWIRGFMAFRRSGTRGP